MNPIKIIIADDHPLLRQALKTLIKNNRNLDVVAEAVDGEEAVKLAKKLSPDIIIMDISMPKLNGIEATRQISRECPGIGILVFTVHDDNDTVLSIIQAGAKGYLLKTATGGQILQAIRAVMEGETVWAFPTRDIISKTSQSKKIDNISRKLSPRESEILKLVAKGRTNKEIASRLGLQETSIKSYLSSLFIKLDVGTRTEAVAVGLQFGIITTNDFTK